ncbi:MAG: response regulator transcription factor [Clostridiales bacterium]|nr:response regulator transcription factor [Clostridiales bacterium]
MENRPEVKTKVLVVDDDKRILQILRLYLIKDGYDVITAERGDNALDLALSESPAIVILDIMLPGMDGWEVLENLRRSSDVPVIMLTARGDITDRIQGLDRGADDYIVKPFEPKELLARVKAVLRRSFAPQEEIKSVTIGDLSVSLDNYTVSLGGKKQEMPPKEIELLHFFATHPNRVYTRDQILDAVWGFGYYGDSRTVDVHIKRLRDRLGESPFWNIETIWGVGYRFNIKKNEN